MEGRVADWLFSSGKCSVAGDFSARERLGFRHGDVRAFLEETQVLPGLWLYRGEATGQSRFCISVDGGARDEGRIILGSVLNSRGVMHLEGCGEQSWREDGRAYVMTPISRRVDYEIDASRGWRTVALRLERQALEQIGPDGAVPELVRAALEGRRDDVVEVSPLSGALRSLGHSMLRPTYTGQMQMLFRQSKVLEMLAHFLDALDAGAGAALTPGEASRVRMARDRLLADLRDPPDLDTLAREVGLTAKRLNRGFRSLYGTTVFTYLRDARLDAARAALEAGSPLSLKQLAWELGYGQVSNFVTAFRRRFGTTPGNHRRRVS